jgi:glycosyltransferase involved in cell wall biosynthesis
MSAGCLVIGSDTAPVREVLNNKNGLLVPFFDYEQLAGQVIEALAYPRRFRSLRVQARQTILDQYDLVRICLPNVLRFIKKGIGPKA